MEASDGALWIGTRANGILRFYPASEKIVQGETARIESENEHNGLTANFAFESVEDAEGSVWVATTNGLDQFRPVPFRAMDVGQTAPIVLPQGEPGSSFMISSDHVVDLTTGKPVSLKLGKPEWTRSLYRSSDGVLWIGTVGHLWRYVGGRFARQSLPREVTNSVPPPVLAVLEDTDHGIWVSLGSGFGLFRWDSGRWVKGGGYPALLGGIVMATERDANGALWFGYRDGRVARLSGGQVDFFGKLEGLDLGVINVFAKHGGELWVAGEEGVALWRQDRFYPVHLADQYVLQGITGAAFTADGSLWINQLTGVFRIDSAELDRWRSQPGYAVKCNVFDSHDGLRGVPHPIVGLGSAKSAPDGRLYVATRTNLQWIDPLHLPHNGVLPQVWITGWKTDRANGSWPSAALNLEPRASNLEIDYVATSLLIPERVRFRYKLEGFDDGWVDASSRRQAFYPKLPPGHYTFKVIACNDSGVWNNGGASFIFAIPPTFIQTIWFKILCVIVLACMVTFAYILRMRHVATQIRRGMYERMAEREDIARNLHDTFFQNVQGLLLRFNTATSKLSSDEPARELLQDTLKQSDQVMLEGRRLLVGLHDQAPQHVDLHTALAEYGRELQKSYGVALDVVVNGSVHALHPVVLEEVLNVGREALSNSFRHSKGRSIEAEITYEPKVLRMRVRDDGTGVDSHILKQGHREGHLGFPGMRERAKKIGARLDIWSREGMGTEIELSVNSAIAYVAEQSVEKKRRPHRAS